MWCSEFRESITRVSITQRQEYAVKRLEAALKSFGPGFHVYQYLFKSNRPEIPFASYEDPVVQTEVNHRREFFAAKRDDLYQIEIFYCILLRGCSMQRPESGRPSPAWPRIPLQHSKNSGRSSQAAA